MTFSGLIIILLIGIRGLVYDIKRWLWGRENESSNKVRTSAKPAPKQYNKSIAVLGMKDAGKTSLHCALRNENYVKFVTGIEPYSAYTYKKKDGTQVKIKGGVDIGGGNDFRTKYYPMIKTADIVFFLFDLNLYRKDEEYRKETRSRLEFITRKCNECNHTMVTLITHKDLFSPEELKNAIAEYKQDIIACSHSSTPYEDAVIKYKYYDIDTTNKVEINQLMDKLL